MASAISLRSSIASSVDIAQTVSDSPFTVEWLVQSLLDNDSKFCDLARRSKIEKITAVNVSQGKGYVSTVYNVLIGFENVDEPYQVILKVPGADQFNADPANTAGDEMITEEFVSSAHNAECEFYNKFAPYLNIPLVKIYNSIEMRIGEHKTAGALLMESMCGRGESCPIQTGASKEQLMNLAKHLATLYAYSLCLPEEELAGKYTVNVMCSLTTNEDVYGPHADKIKVMKPGTFDRALDVFRRYVCSKAFYTYTMTDVYKDIGLPPVLTHGDTWANNVLWKMNADGSLSNELAALIDWQVMHQGCITNDLARYMTLCVDGDVRREHEYHILRFMYDRIVHLMAEEGKPVEFTFDQMKQAYQVNLVGHSVLMMLMAAFVYSGEGWTPEEMPIKLAQREKVLLRTQLAMEDALVYFENIPKHRLE
ncbi:hypothetical protein QR680_014984 [Steinernema hermaphroditum]|uniref:CHK kinase-like domain-containing protein n=1 Tax=Steinernema hermaphroditum TaxID=289476 RepID=A0AA39M4Y5_9BILA|nr:hypothetical protein QR680_014984 [Steinernema hermaphroditum]